MRPFVERKNAIRAARSVLASSGGDALPTTRSTSFELSGCPRTQYIHTKQVRFLHFIRAVRVKSVCLDPCSLNDTDTHTLVFFAGVKYTLRHSPVCADTGAARVLGTALGAWLLLDACSAWAGWATSFAGAAFIAAPATVGYIPRRSGSAAQRVPRIGRRRLSSFGRTGVSSDGSAHTQEMMLRRNDSTFFPSAVVVLAGSVHVEAKFLTMFGRVPFTVKFFASPGEEV